MSIFGKISEAIFGKKAAAAEAAAAPASGPAADASQSAPAPTSMSEVDVGGLLNDLAAKSAQPLNWRTSIVDLMKLLGMESSLAERRQLAGELGFTGDTGDTATMNIWLHKEVLKKLAANGGKVPADLLD